LIALILFYIFYDYANYYIIYKLYNNIIYQKIHFFLTKKWYFDLLYNFYIVNYFFNFSYNITFKIIDRGYLEYFGPLNIVRIFNKFSNNINITYHGLIYQNIFIIIIFSIILIYLYFFNYYNIILLFFIFFSIIIYNLLV
jgi:NADH-ubiquinone oxidoreductase chain 5